MSNTLKRYRQLNIFESFTCSKRAKGNSVTPNENTTYQRELSGTSENSIKMSSSIDIDDNISTCKAVEHSSVDVSANKQLKLDTKPSNIEETMPSSLNLDDNTNAICHAVDVSADKQLKLDTKPSNIEETMPSSLNLDDNTNAICHAVDVSADKQLKLDTKPSNVEETQNAAPEFCRPGQMSGLFAPRAGPASSLNLDDNTNAICHAAENSFQVETKMDVSKKTSSIDTKTEECFSKVQSLQNSDDLFSGKSSSLEDYSIPSSSHSEELFADSVDNDSSGNAAISEGSDSPEPAHIHPGVTPRPYPNSYRDKWDSDHVRMPCSPQNRYPVADINDVKRIESRWNLICESLRSEITSSRDLEAAIMKYNSQYIDKWNFVGLHDFINRHLAGEERDHFFEVILPVMIEMTLDLPNICTQPIPLLKKGKDHSLTMSQKQIGCLLLNAFFCTYPRRTLPRRRKKERWICEYATYPDINFNRLFYGTKNGIPSQSAEKLKCLFNYFRRITAKEPTGTVTFHRQSLEDEDLPEWSTSTRGIRTAVIKSSGLIETDGCGMLQADFANKFVGGGVLGGGCVQEEIRFIICPEFIISRLFVECLGNKEVLIITGAEQFNKYSGYADTFKWEGNFVDETPRDLWGRRYTQLVAMDAISFRVPDMQYKSQLIRRELNKAYCAFYQNAPPAHLPAVATGNWGCGAFKGNPKLKFLIQLMAASETGRSVLYFTFGNIKLKKQLQDMHDFLSDKNLTVGDVWRLLMRYDENISSCNKTKYSNLYEFIYAQFLKKENPRHQDEEFSLDNSDQTIIEDVTSGDSSKESEDDT